ncbi:hypothetical protein HYH03_013517 [Edaphochlamys debaryana]|uniref:Uncharacterized protein n=1 Tax=Edaphochlamys debaryana TaxID=47281 RepID=A0A835XPP3_9CHLO|nr:hypothetical protein HYH03_013517 [Edaphochlamys debaryana]|eukprot:KAG2487938.1 hypothetical protein HYH03_013517 [Edaphochlamys debaryana]
MAASAFGGGKEARSGNPNSSAAAGVRGLDNGYMYPEYLGVANGPFTMGLDEGWLTVWSSTGDVAWRSFKSVP